MDVPRKVVEAHVDQLNHVDLDENVADKHLVHEGEEKTAAEVEEHPLELEDVAEKDSYSEKLGGPRNHHPQGDTGEMDSIVEPQ